MAIGECGLDQYWVREHAEEQSAYFVRSVGSLLSIIYP